MLRKVDFDPATGAVGVRHASFDDIARILIRNFLPNMAYSLQTVVNGVRQTLADMELPLKDDNEVKEVLRWMDATGLHDKATMQFKHPKEEAFGIMADFGINRRFPEEESY